MTDTQPLTGRTAIVTGASRGIGRAIALALADAGAAVVIAARTEEASGDVVGTIHTVAAEVRARGVRALAVRCDLTRPEDITALVDETRAAFGTIDILVNNAGIMWLGPILDTPLTRWELVLRVNLTGTFLCTQAVLPVMRAQRRGVLIAISTTGVRMVEMGANVYWVSKQAVERLYLGLAHELRPLGIMATVLAPTGVVDTPGWRRFSAAVSVPPEMIEPPEVMGRAVVRLASGAVPDAAGRVWYSRDVVRGDGGL
jgi:NAD(P)-dependent dehydrogenase (short-subunit alcohol dehydrogenase family)